MCYLRSCLSIVILVMLPLVCIASQNLQEASQSQRVVLQGGVSLDNAMAQEGQRVDWYAWYLKARQSIMANGGLQCPLGTLIIISKQGLFKTDSPYKTCQQSVDRQRSPLPANSQLSYIVLPVRDGAWHPMSPPELLERVQP
jgi:hypothetical protein